jgi:hypothetical protein
MQARDAAFVSMIGGTPLDSLDTDSSRRSFGNRKLQGISSAASYAASEVADMLLDAIRFLPVNRDDAVEAVDTAFADDLPAPCELDLVTSLDAVWPSVQ